MPSIDYNALENFISENVVSRFYELRIRHLQSINLRAQILNRKNPYLFKAKNITTSEAFVRSALDAFLSSQEETIFGNLMESLAIYVCEQTYGGRKAEQGVMRGIDLEFDKDGTYYIVGIKSGVNWGNSSQISDLKNSFKAARRLLAEAGVTLPIVAINGCIYGKVRNPLQLSRTDPDKTYYKYAGQEFWDFISGDPDLYVTIIHPLDIEARKRGPEFQAIYDAKINEMTLEFAQEFLTNNLIDWQRLIEYVSKRPETSP